MAYDIPFFCLYMIHLICGLVLNPGIALRIILVISSLSRVKCLQIELNKKLRAIMTRWRLSNLAWLPVEHKFCENLEYNHIIGDFPMTKARKINFIEQTCHYLWILNNYVCNLLLPQTLPVHQRHSQMSTIITKFSFSMFCQFSAA